MNQRSAQGGRTVVVHSVEVEAETLYKAAVTRTLPIRVNAAADGAPPDRLSGLRFREMKFTSLTANLTAKRGDEGGLCLWHPPFTALLSRGGRNLCATDVQ